MSDPRLKARFLVQAALRQAFGRGVFGAIVRSGDDDAGGILVLLRDRDDQVTVLIQAQTGDGRSAWMRAGDGRPLARAEADAYVARALERDPDLWVVEFDASGGQPPFDAILLPDRHGG